MGIFKIFSKKKKKKELTLTRREAKALERDARNRAEYSSRGFGMPVNKQ